MNRQSVGSITRRLTLMRTLGTGAIAGLPLALGACLPGEDAAGPVTATKEAVTVTVLDRPPSDPLVPDYDTINARFMQAHPNIKVERLDTAGQNRDQKFQVLAAAGTPSDLLWMDQQFAGPFREQGMLRALDSFIKRDKYDLQDFFPVAQQFYQFKGQTFGVLHTASPRIYVYNKSLFEKKGVRPPHDDWTWGDLRDALRRLTDGVGDEATFGGAMGRNLEFPGFVYQNGGKLVDDMHLPTKALLDQPAALEAIQFHVDLELKDGISVADAKRTGGLTPSQLWTAGRLGINHTSIWSHKTWAAQLPFDWDQTVPAKNKARASMLSSSGHIISAVSKVPEETWLLLKEMNSIEAQSDLSRTGGLMLGRKSVASSDAFLRAVPKPANMKAFVAAMDYAYPTRLVNGLAVEFYDLTVKQMAPVWEGTQGVPQAVTELVRQANAMFADYAAKLQR